MYERSITRTAINCPKVEYYSMLENEVLEILSANNCRNVMACLREWRENNVTKFQGRNFEEITIRWGIPPC